MAKKTYSHLSQGERDRIANLRAQGYSMNRIARDLRRDKGTISRELQRNSTSVYQCYGSGSADRRAKYRRSLASRHPRLNTPGLRAYVKKKLQRGWSPEQIAGRITIDHPNLSVSHEAIYQYIYTPSIRRQEDLVPYLPRSHWKRQPKGHRHTHRKSHIPGRISVKDRPEGIIKRRQYGHWENDLIISRRSPVALNILVERKSRFSKITRVSRHTPQETRRAITRSLSSFPSRARRSITYDNGHENLEHLTVNQRLRTKSYFCEPYHSWEKGTVENTAGLVRRVFPKQTDFAAVSRHQVKRLEKLLNNRPRKSLSFKTPKEVFNRVLH